MSEADVHDVEVNTADNHTAPKNIARPDAPDPNDHEKSAGKSKPIENDSANDVQSRDDPTEGDNDSEAETLIQSPEKKRSLVESAPTGYQVKNTAASDAGSVGLINASDKENANRKRKRLHGDGGEDRPGSANSSRHSSPLSSPLAHASDQESDRGSHTSLQQRRQKKREKREDSPEFDGKITSPKKRRRRPSDIQVSNSSHKRSKHSSLDLTERRETRSATYPHPSDEDQSASPEPPSRREHRRGASTQLTSHEFDRKKRGRPPNIQTRSTLPDYQNSDSSDDSDANSRSRPPLNKLTPHDHDTMSPAKTGPRKWKDKNGRTYLARACANEDLELARQKMQERPGDLNLPDNAGNTPLQIASLEGFESIVEFLLGAGADVNVRNLDKDTPLIDAVENGHVEVIKLLLKHGANPRMGNARGDEPYELVHPDDESYDDIRALLTEAKDRSSRKGPVADHDPSNRDGASSRAASAASPRDSPPIGTRSPPTAFGSRRRTGRSESTRNDLLWQANTQENLAKLASKGDVQGVVSILSILEKADTESLIAAAKAGHEEVLQMLIAMGKPNADPHPVPGHKGGPMYATPMLAAIGRGHPDVVKLLANQPGFNIMRKYKEQTYFELAKARRGEKWQQEYEILKQAYEKAALARGRKMNSPRKTRDADKAKAKTSRRSSSPPSVKRQSTSPALTHKSLARTDSAQKDKRKVSDPMLDKRKPTSHNDTGDSSVAVASDMDQSIAQERKTHRTRRSQSDLPPLAAADAESSHKRRRLVTGKEHRRQNIPSSSDMEEAEAARVKQEEKSHTTKRSRPSPTPDPAPTESREARSAHKKRRTVLESSPDTARSNLKVSSPTVNIKTLPSANQANVDTESVEDAASIHGGGATDEPDVKEVKREISQQPELLLNESKVESTAVGESSATDAENVESSIEPQREDTIDGASAAETVNATNPSEDQVKDDQEEKEAAIREEAARKAREEEQKRLAEQKAEQERLERAQQEAERRAREEEEQRKVREAEAKAKAEAQKKAEEEEQARQRAEKERQEIIRQAAEHQRRLEEQEAERLRAEALPIVLCRTARMIDSDDATVRSFEWLSKYLPLFTVRTQQLDPLCAVAIANEKWIPNFQAAGLLLHKDLSLSGFPSIARREATTHHRLCMWRVSRLKLSYDFSSEWIIPVPKAIELENVAQEKFFKIDELFWVKLSDFLSQVSQTPHLQGLNLPLQAISLKTYDELFSSRNGKLNSPHHGPVGMPNGIKAVTVLPNGDNAINH